AGDPLKLLGDPLGVAGQGLRVEQVPLLGPAARVADHPGRAAGQGDRVVPGVSEAPQHQEADEVADVEGVRARVAAVVHADRASLNPVAQRVAVGAVLDEAPGLEVGEKVHAFMIPHPTSWPGSIKTRPLLRGRGRTKLARTGAWLRVPVARRLLGS